MGNSDYREERLATIRSINAQNKRRGKAMERRVMKELRGNRVPMSGAGSIKGDGIILHPQIGYIFVECKMSAAVNIHGVQKLRVDYRWLDKMRLEASIMNARFPILIIHHQDSKQDYVIVHTEDFTKYITVPDFSHTIDTGNKNGWTAIRQNLEVVLACYNELILLQTNRGPYVVCTLQHFKELLHGE